MSKRRPSLVEELHGMPSQYVSSRINDALREIPGADRNQLLSDYHQSGKSKDGFFLAKLIDTFWASHAMKKQKKALKQHLAEKSPVSDSSSTSAHQPRRNISAPTTLPDSCGNDKQVADYIFKRTLGKGTFGKVKLAEHIRTKEKFAVKVIEKSNIKTQKQKISVDREVRLMKLLNHPHIVGVHEVYQTKHYIWIVMENANGGELFDYIVKNGHVKEPEARRLFRQVLSAVDYCHQNSIIHRDLKPENLLLDSNMNIKIIDFGFGNTFHRDRLLDTYCGSPFYAAPEMIQGIRYVGPEVDIWSMGVILYALLSGRLPFDAATMNELYEKIAKGSYVCPSYFSQESKHLIARALTIDPKNRATINEIKNHVWINIGYREPVSSYMMDRPTTVTTPHPDSFAELISYGFKEEETYRILKNENKQHPIVSLYHLIDETRMRQEQQMGFEETAFDSARNERLNSVSTLGSRRSVDSTSSSYSRMSQEYQEAAQPIKTPSKSISNRYFPRFSKRAAEPTSHLSEVRATRSK